MNPSRRRFLFGAATTLVAAPAIVRVAANLMPVSTRAFTPTYLNSMWEHALNRVVNPPLIAMPILNDEPVSIGPGWITYVIDDVERDSFRPAFNVVPGSVRRLPFV